MTKTNFFFENIEYIVAVVALPLIVYGTYKIKKFKPKKNNLTSRYIKFKKQEEAINKRIKGGTIF